MTVWERRKSPRILFLLCLMHRQIVFLWKSRQAASFRDLVAELKDPDKDCSGTPESFLEEYAAFVRKFHREIGWYNDPYYDTVYPCLDGSQLASLCEMTQAICSAAEGILHKVERMMEK